MSVLYTIIVTVVLAYVIVISMSLLPCCTGCNDLATALIVNSKVWNAVQNSTVGFMSVLNGFTTTVSVSVAGNVAVQCAAATIVNVGTAFGAVDMLENSAVDTLIANATSLASIAGLGFYSMYRAPFSTKVGVISLIPFFVFLVLLLFVQLGKSSKYIRPKPTPGLDPNCHPPPYLVDLFEIVELSPDDRKHLTYRDLLGLLDVRSHIARLVVVTATAAISLYVGSVPFHKGCLRERVSIDNHSWPQKMLAVLTLISAILLMVFEVVHLAAAPAAFAAAKANATTAAEVIEAAAAAAAAAAPAAPANSASVGAPTSAGSVQSSNIDSNYRSASVAAASDNPTHPMQQVHKQSAPTLQALLTPRDQQLLKTAAAAAAAAAQQNNIKKD